MLATMDPQRLPSSTEFVVNGADPDRVRGTLANSTDLDDAEIVEADQSMLVVRVGRKSKEPKTAWRHLQSTLGDECVVTPALLDDSGATLYPTGTIQIRFRKPPSDDEIDSFAKLHLLRQPKRNRYQPAQISFEIEQPSRSYLPDLVAELDRSDKVLKAWPETKSAYRRLRPA